MCSKPVKAVLSVSCEFDCQSLKTAKRLDFVQIRDAPVSADCRLHTWKSFIFITKSKQT